MLSGTDQELGADLLRDTKREFLRGGIVHWNDDHSAQCASKKRRHPLGGIWPPNQNAFAFGDSSICQLTRAAKCQFGNLAIGPARSAISAALYVGVLLASLYKAAEIFADRAALHRTAPHLIVFANP